MRDDVPQYVRAHLAKRDGHAKRVDIGGVAVGLFVMLAGFAGTVAITPPPWVGTGILTVTAFGGGYFAGRIGGKTGSCGACHGVAVGIAGLIVATVGTISSAVADGEATTFGVVDWAPDVLGATVVVVILVAIVGSVLGDRGRKQ